MELSFLQDIMVLFFLSAAVLFVTMRLHMPAIVGLLITGVISGPHGLQLISGIDQVETLARLGLILLLFTLGMEFPLKQIFVMKKAFFLGGSIQVVLTCLFGAIIGQALSRPLGESIFLGFLLSLSSTAIVLKLLTDRFEENTMHGKITLAILIFQDIVSVPMLLFIPLLAGAEEAMKINTWLILIAKSGFLICLVLVFSIKVMPQLLYHVAKSKIREMFILIMLAICFSITWLAAAMGLPPSLGAFLAGLILAESEYHYQAIGNILPLQDILISLFFISIGMLLDIHFLFDSFLLVIGVAICVMLMKIFTAGVAAMALRIPFKTVILTALALAQIGEFSFVLGKVGLESGIASGFHYQLFLAVSLITMACTPLLIAAAPSIAHFVCSRPVFQNPIFKALEIDSETHHRRNEHVLIIGYGVSGQHLAEGCKLAGIDYAVLEMNPDIVRQARTAGEPIYFGDATHQTLLNHLNIQQAKGVAVAIDDPQATKRIVKNIRAHHPHLPIFVRTLHIKEAAALLKLGATDVIPCDAEATIALYTKLLESCAVGEEKIASLGATIRTSMYATEST